MPSLTSIEARTKEHSTKSQGVAAMEEDVV